MKTMTALLKYAILLTSADCVTFNAYDIQSRAGFYVFIVFTHGCWHERHLDSKDAAPVISYVFLDTMGNHSAPS